MTDDQKTSTAAPIIEGAERGEHIVRPDPKGRKPTPIEQEAEDTKAETDGRALEKESHDRRET